MPGLAIDGFVASRSGDWAELDAACAVVESGAALDPDRVLRLGTLHRETVADLAYARRQFAGAPLVARLEELVATSREVVYDAPPRRSAAPVLAFAARGWWRLLALSLRWNALGVAAVVGCLLVAAAWAAHDPVAATRTLPVSLQRIPLGPHGTLADAAGLPRGVPGIDASWTAAAALVLGLAALGGGVLAGIGTAVAAVAGGLQLGVPIGLAVHAGLTGRLVAPAAADGLLLLVLVGICAGQGVRIGAAVVRRAGIAETGRDAALVLLGLLPWFGVAAGLRALAGGNADGTAPLGLLAVVALAAGVIALGGPALRRPAR